MRIHESVLWLFLLLVLLLLTTNIFDNISDIFDYPKTDEVGFLYSFQTLFAGIFAFIGGTSVYFAARKQAIASLKEKWLHDFRNNVIEFLDHSSRLNELEADQEHFWNIIRMMDTEEQGLFGPADLPRHQKRKKRYETKYEETQKTITISQQASHRLMLQVQLFLDKNKQSHRNLDSLLGEWIKNSDQFKKLLQNDLSEEIKKQLNEIMEKSWKLKQDIIHTTRIIMHNEINSI